MSQECAQRDINCSYFHVLHINHLLANIPNTSECMLTAWTYNWNECRNE